MPRRCECDRCTKGGPYQKGECVLCWHFHNTPAYREKWGGGPLPAPPPGSVQTDVGQLVQPTSTPPPAPVTAVPESSWPWAVWAVAKLRHFEDKGLGDTVHRNLSLLGADAMTSLYTKLTGQNCGCTDRQAKLNQLYPYQK